MQVKSNLILKFYTPIIKMLAAQKSSKKVILDRIEKANSLYFKAWLLGKTTHYKARHAERNLKA